MSLNNKFWKELTVTPVDRWSDDEEEQMSINRWMHGGLPCMIYNCGSVGVYCQKNWLVSAITCIHTISLTSKHQTNYNGPFSHILPHSQWNFSFTAAFKSKNFVPPRFPRHCFGASRRHGAASWKRIHAETWTHPCFIFEVWKVFLSTLKIWQSHKPQKTEVKFSPALKSVSCLRFVPLTFYENQSANLVSGSKRAEEKIFWRWTWLCSAAAKNGFLCPMSKCLGVCRGFCFKPQSCHSKTEMTNKKRESRERENEVINQIQQTEVSENGWCVFLVFSASIGRVTQDSCIIRLYQCPLASWSH